MRKMPNVLTVNMWSGEVIKPEHLRLDDLLFSQYAYEQKLVHAILLDGKQQQLNTVAEYMQLQDSHSNLLAIKIEGMEKLTEAMYRACDYAVNGLGKPGPFSCHCFISPEKSVSFPDHTDPDGVLLYVVEGIKTIHANGKTYDLVAGSVMYIPPGTVHRAENRHSSIMLSIGFDRYISEKLC